METLYIIGACLILLVLLILIIDIGEYELRFYVFTALMSLVGLTCIIIGITFDSKPTAIDVYRGKTTLEITYRDSIPVDSVVVFKKK